MEWMLLRKLAQQCENERGSEELNTAVAETARGCGVCGESATLNLAPGDQVEWAGAPEYTTNLETALCLPAGLGQTVELKQDVETNSWVATLRSRLNHRVQGRGRTAALAICSAALRAMAQAAVAEGITERIPLATRDWQLERTGRRQVH
jgi:hypothetical protein